MFVEVIASRSSVVFLRHSVYLLRPRKGRCELLRSVCLYVYLYSRVSGNPHVQTSQNFLYILPVAVVLSFSDDNVMHFRFCGWRHVFKGQMGQNQRHCLVKFARRSYQSAAAPRGSACFEGEVHVTWCVCLSVCMLGTCTGEVCRGLSRSRCAVWVADSYGPKMF